MNPNNSSNKGSIEEELSTQGDISADKFPEANSFDKIDVESLIKDFKITNLDNFNVYLQQLSQDLCSQSDNPGLGINKITFLNYFQMPGLIGERIYSVFDKNKSGYLEIEEFINGMTILYTEDFNSLAKFVFDLYDFDRNELISKEDIRVILSYIPLKFSKTTSHKKDFINIVESQEELNALIDKCFSKSNEYMDFKSFFYAVQNISSEIVLYILIFLLNKRPFSKETLNQYDNIILRGISTPKNLRKIQMMPGMKIMVPSPSIKSKFSSSVTIKHSPYMQQKAKSSYLDSKQMISNNLASKNLLNLFAVKHDSNKLQVPGGGTGIGTVNEKKASNQSKEGIDTHKTSFSLSNTISISKPTNVDDIDSLTKIKRIKKKVNSTDVVNKVPDKEQLESIDESDSKIKTNTQIKRKPRAFLKSLQEDNLLPIMKMKGDEKIDEPKQQDTNQIQDNTTTSTTAPTNQSKEELSKAFRYNYTNPFLDHIIDEEEDELKEQIEEEVQFEGYLYKIFRMKKVKQRYFKLIQKDLYTYEHKGDSNHKGLHNLSGVFIEQCENCEVNNKMFFSFRLIFTKKTRYYYCDNESEYKIWLSKLRSVTGFFNLMDSYGFIKKLGKGKFASVKLGTKLTTKEEVAIKIINKEAMLPQDLELTRTEIEIMKICKHPYIIKLSEVFENRIYIYIIMEYCKGGDMFSYLEKRTFKIKESRAAELTYQIMTALYYLHSFGIVHRDIKLENIMMVDDSDKSDIRLVDFGLSKLIGPNEKCTESFGTLGYVAPEVLTLQPYDKSADAWSLGIVAYLLITGCLPYDDEDPKEIIRQTIEDPVPFPKYLWKNFSLESKSFVHNLLQKNPKKRMTIKEAMDHPWLKINDKASLSGQRETMKENQMSDFKIYTHVKEEEVKESWMSTLTNTPKTIAIPNAIKKTSIIDNKHQ